MRRGLAIVAGVVGALLLPSICWALVSVADEGHWPASWPKELEGLRKQAKTVSVAHGIQETVYEIRFNSREQFEKAWPHILNVKGAGAPLILARGPSTYGRSGTKLEVGVRIMCPSGGMLRSADGKEMKADAPWPDSAKLPGGELPEYVVAQDGKWVPAEGNERRGFLHRARVDVMLVVDGAIIDLNKTALPADTPIIDRRFGEAPAGVRAQIRALVAQLGAEDWRARQAAQEKLVRIGEDALKDLEDLRRQTADEEVRTRIETAIGQIKDPAPLEQWGKGADGIQVRLAADKHVWKEGEEASFKVTIRNDGKRQFQTSGICSIAMEVDGKAMGPKAWRRSGLIPQMAFGPGTQHVFAATPGDFDGSISAGKHKVRAALLDNVHGNGIHTSLADYPQGVLAFSNTVEIEIVAKGKEDGGK